MNIHTVVAPVISATLLVLAVGSAQAYMYQEQTQKSSQSHSFSSSCDGDECSNTSKVSFKSKSTLKQSQSQSYGDYNNNWHGNSKQWDKWPRYGSATISWDHRGGTCHIRYSESNVYNYKYSTATPCDEGSIVIGGLHPGSTYRFQVRKDSGEWSSPMWRSAH